MELARDLSVEAVAEFLPDRQVRSYPALLSTEADAQAWARAGASSGSVVVADYQASPRGRAGLEWKVEPGKTLAFSMIVRPRLTPEREGWTYTAATTALAEVLAPDATIRWPDEVRVQGARVGAVGIHVELGSQEAEWAVVNVLVPRPSRPRTETLAEIVVAIEARLAQNPAEVLADYLKRLETTGRQVTALMIPMGPGGPQVSGKAVGSLADGALLIETDEGRRIAVRPQNLGLLEDPPHSPRDASNG